MIRYREVNLFNILFSSSILRCVVSLVQFVLRYFALISLPAPVEINTTQYCFFIYTILKSLSVWASVSFLLQFCLELHCTDVTTTMSNTGSAPFLPLSPLFLWSRRFSPLHPPQLSLLPASQAAWGAVGALSRRLLPDGGQVGLLLAYRCDARFCQGSPWRSWWQNVQPHLPSPHLPYHPAATAGPLLNPAQWWGTGGRQGLMVFYTLCFSLCWWGERMCVLGVLVVLGVLGVLGVLAF